ncbi:hypothetical protein ACFFV7_46685 [Nonomuraea spiralis]|uniref:Uncharacterized protein n=1 Tax=Nonomuraea spiralis TaxID=46182 RepID=A0ABV5IVZ8_9ACTN|nr:hypothetical protein [Nonomuraea spiralis]GGS84704.1 hypothetical protein GCM10010176_030530 [Nonomuraea spiralis]
MVVDVLYPGWVPFKNVAISQDIPGWLRAQDVAMTYPWRTLVDGYLGTLAAADVFTEDNAFGLLESMRIDAGLLGPFGIRP